MFSIGRCSQLLTLLAVLTFAKAAGQSRTTDLIIKKDSSKTECRILLVAAEVIQYKKFTDPQGPIFHILISDVAKVIYGNGETDDFNIPSSFGHLGSKSDYLTGPWTRRSFTQNLSIWKTGELQTAEKFYHTKAQPAKIMGITMSALGTLIAVKGLSMFINAKESDQYGHYIDQRERKIGSLLMIAGVGTGIGLGAGGLLSFKNYRKKANLVRKEIATRNTPLTQILFKPRYAPRASQIGLSLIVKF